MGATTLRRGNFSNMRMRVIFLGKIKVLSHTFSTNNGKLTLFAVTFVAAVFRGWFQVLLWTREGPLQLRLWRMRTRLRRTTSFVFFIGTCGWRYPLRGYVHWGRIRRRIWIPTLPEHQLHYNYATATVT